MPNPQWFEGLEEDKITWYSNSKRPRLIGPTVWEAEEITGFSNHDVIIEKLHMGLEEDKITWHSNQRSRPQSRCGLEEDKITWFSNLLLRCKDKEIAGHSNIYWLIVTAAKGLAEDKITWYSNSCCYRSTRFGEEKATWYSNVVHPQRVGRR